MSDSEREPSSNPRPPAVGWRAVTPNILTLGRLALTAWFIALLALVEPSPQNTWAFWACALFVVAALTDAADGYLARKWNAVSKFGRIMDPLADKVLVLGAFIMLSGNDLGDLTGVAPWMTVVILFRELFVTTARSVFESSGVDFSAAWSGKIKMILQSVAIPLILIDIGIANDPSAGPGPLAIWSAWAATIATAVSLLPYLTRIAGLIASPQSQ